jgi:hypothetical protein
MPARYSQQIPSPGESKPARARQPPVEKLERFVKFKPQTPLREIIRLTAG